jgi:hypothetical protein
MRQLRTTGLLLTALPMPAEPLRLAAFEGAAEPATALARLEDALGQRAPGWRSYPLELRDSGPPKMRRYHNLLLEL